MSSLYKYKNGNYSVTIFDDGTKIRETSDDKFLPKFPESIDLKITNKCDLVCPWCHELSHITGAPANVDMIKGNLGGLPNGAEIAIGGGNPMTHPQLSEFLHWLKDNGFIANITINANHLSVYKKDIVAFINDGLLKGVGISFNAKDYFDYPNTVYHVIAGVHSFGDIKYLIESGRKLLVLGYKTFGRGKKYNKNVKENILYLKNNMWKLIGKGDISFDNLAIKQLNIKAFLPRDEWVRFYMGDDGQFTMYYDAVKNEYALSSISIKRTTATIPVSEWFAKNRNR